MKEHKLLNAECVELLQFRINEEEFSSRLYEDMSLWLNDKGYKNAAALWMKYSQEEKAHSDWAKGFLLSFGIKPELRALKEPAGEYDSFPAIIRASYEHEVLITDQCNELWQCALNNNAGVLFGLAQKYVSEQVEELDKLQNFLDRLETFGEDQHALALFEHDLENYL